MEQERGICVTAMTCAACPRSLQVASAVSLVKSSLPNALRFGSCYSRLLCRIFRDSAENVARALAALSDIQEAPDGNGVWRVPHDVTSRLMAFESEFGKQQTTRLLKS